MIKKTNYKTTKEEQEMIEKAMKTKHLSLRKIAPMLEISHEYLHFLITGIRWFNEDQLTRLEEILNIKLH